MRTLLAVIIVRSLVKYVYVFDASVILFTSFPFILLHLFYAIYPKYPTKIAVIIEDTRLTYGVDSQHGT